MVVDIAALLLKYSKNRCVGGTMALGGAVASGGAVLVTDVGGTMNVGGMTASGSAVDSTGVVLLAARITSSASA